MEEKKMSKKEFWIRFAFWTVFSLILPVVFVGWRYGIFTEKTGLTGGGMLAVSIIAVFLIVIIKNARSGLESGSMALQCIDGFTWIIPLVALAAVIKIAENNLAAFEQTLIFIIVCESIAIPVNPSPKWIAQNKIERTSDLLTSIIESVKGDKK